MDRGVKIAAASAVLLGGIAVALLFRRESPQPDPARPVGAERLVPRQYIQMQVSDSPGLTIGDSRTETPAVAAGALKTAGATASPVGPIDTGGPPPPLPREYPASEIEEAIRRDTSRDLPPPQVPSAAEAVQTHKIVDGDTLEALAERYLGSADRAMEIYQINRDVMGSPELLPIGAQLKVVPPANLEPPRTTIAPRGRLVPIRPKTH